MIKQKLTVTITKMISITRITLYTVGHKNDTFIFVITLANVDRFS